LKKGIRLLWLDYGYHIVTDGTAKGKIPQEKKGAVNQCEELPVNPGDAINAI